jgi:hypothetical protein
MSSQVQPVGTVPITYRVIAPAQTIDATGGTTEVDANAKFNTNLPLDRYMLITQTDVYVTVLTGPVFGAGSGSHSSHVEWQLTEALARTAPVFSTDPVYVDEGLERILVDVIQATAVGEEVAESFLSLQPYRHVLSNPWATAAQQLNFIARWKPWQVGSLSAGPKLSVAMVIEYSLLSLTPSVQSYLATRIQIAGQA